MAREHEDLYLIILKYYRGAALANPKGNHNYHTGYTYIKLEFATALNVRTQEYAVNNPKSDTTFGFGKQITERLTNLWMQFTEWREIRTDSTHPQQGHNPAVF